MYSIATRRGVVVNVLLLIMKRTEYSSSLHVRRQPTCAIEDKEYNIYSIVNHQASLHKIRLRLGLLLAST